MSVSNPFRGSVKHGEKGSEEERAEALEKMAHFQKLMAGDQGRDGPQRPTETEPAGIHPKPEEPYKAKPPTPPAARRSRKSMEIVPSAMSEVEHEAQDPHLRHKPSLPPPRRAQRSSSRPERSEKEVIDVGRQRSDSFGRRAAPPPPHQRSFQPEALHSPRAEESEEDLLANLSQLQREIDALRGMDRTK